MGDQQLAATIVAAATLNFHKLLLSIAGLCSIHQRARGKFLYKLDFVLLVWLAIAAENIVVPSVRLRVELLLPRTPRIDRIRFSIDQSPVVGTDFVLMEDGKNLFNG